MSTKIKIYQVDAFASKVFSGNPAAVCPLAEWLDEEIMQKIAEENNLSETAFYVHKDGKYHIRWFTPTTEVDLCGHANLASAFVLFNYENYQQDFILFYSHRSGQLGVSKNGDWLSLNFPSDSLYAMPMNENFEEVFGVQPQEFWKGNMDYLFVFEHEDIVKNLRPDFIKLSKWAVRGVIVTAKGRQTDFVSRFFAPQSGILEDPVTGSAHTSLTPFWAKRLEKKELTALQVSPRGGYLRCQDLGERVSISGQAKLYMLGEIYL